MRAQRIDQAGEPRSARIESVRALTALGVVAGHVYGASLFERGLELEGSAPRLVQGGVLTVYVFFALSGYLLYWPFAKRSLGGGPRIDLARYARNRALRILPLYFVAVAVYLLVIWKGGTGRQWLLFMTLSENFARDTAAQVVPVAWSLVVEVHFYLLLPFLALFIGRVSHGSLRRAAAAILGLGALSFALRFPTLYAAADPNPILRYSLPSCFMFFAAGMLLAPLRLALERRRPPFLDGVLGEPALWLAGALFLFAGAALGGYRGFLLAPAGALAVGACVLPLRPSRALDALAWRPLALLGVASYSLFLWHPLMSHLTRRWFDLEGPWSLAAAVVPASIAAAALSYALIERPFLRLRRRWTRAPAPAATAT
jgi:peptidoglycan/LPS O-acetylase OafA/YrhL